MPQEFTLSNEFICPNLERRLLAAIVARPEIYWEVLDLLPPEAFTENRQIFEEIGRVIEKEAPLPEVEGEAAQDPLGAAKKLAELYQKRLLAKVTQDFLKNLYSETSPVELIATLEDDLAQVQQAVKELRVGQVVSLSELLPEVVSEVRARQQAVKERGIVAVGLPTGIGRLDKLLGGLQPGLHLLAAEPGQGKTTFTLQVAATVAQAGCPVLFVSFEETLPRLALKTLCAQAGLEMKKLMDGYGDLSLFERAIREYKPRLENLFFMEGTGRLKVLQVKARALQIMTKRKVNRCLIIIDYLQRWAAGIKKGPSDFRHVVSGLVSDLRELALRLNSPIIVVSSQNRPGQGTASLTSLKESGDLEYSCDTALFLVEAEKRTISSPARAVDLVVEKNRYGDRGRIELIFHPEVGTFEMALKESVKI